MSLLEAIRICHAGKYKCLDVIHYGNGSAIWNPDSDSGWQEYRAARNKLGKHRILTWVLNRVWGLYERKVD